MGDNTEALNIGYLDRLFVLVDDEITKVDRDLEVQAMLYGGDHLPQLFHVIATSGPNHMNDEEIGGDRSAINVNSEITLKSATTQLFTTTPELKTEFKYGRQTIGEPIKEMQRSDSTYSTDSTDSTRGFLVTRSLNPNEEDFEDLPPLSQDEEQETKNPDN